MAWPRDREVCGFNARFCAGVIHSFRRSAVGLSVAGAVDIRMVDGAGLFVGSLYRPIINIPESLAAGSTPNASSKPRR